MGGQRISSGKLITSKIGFSKRNHLRVKQNPLKIEKQIFALKLKIKLIKGK